MAAFIRKLFFGGEKKKITRKDSITGRNHTFTVPYLSKLEGNQLQPGQSLIVRGFVTGSDCFVINLTSGPRVELDENKMGAENTSPENELDNRLLSIRADLAARRVFFNACIDGEWGKEASVKQKWRKGDEFDIRVRCHDENFEIFVEHRLVATFKHYVPISNISHIYINGDVELYTVSWEGKYYNAPYAADIPGNFFPGRRLYVSGKLTKKAKQFTLSFTAGKDVGLSIQARIPARKLVRNSRIDDKWGVEEIQREKGSFPLKRNKAFDLLVACQDNKFAIYVDDVFICGFEHRIPAPSIDKLSIEGDVELQGVHLK